MRRDDLYLDDALTAVRELRAFMATTTEAEYHADPLKQSFVFHRLIILGEAMVKLRPAYERKYPLVPWAQLAGLRNRLVHAYFQLNVARLWTIASQGAEDLERQLETILQAEFPENRDPQGTP